MKENYDVIIVGTGAAGLYCALNLPSRMKVLMLTKQQADQPTPSGTGRYLHAQRRRRL